MSKKPRHLQRIIALVLIVVVSLVLFLSPEPAEALMVALAFIVIIGIAGLFLWSLAKTNSGNGYKGPL